ncbi:hypothetical protein BH11BAC3_BH11BAC3_28090 [soil metagenome]
MHLKKIIVAGILLLAANGLYAQKDWNNIGMDNVVSKDSFTRKGYTLIFINKSEKFDKAIEDRMVDAFFKVYPKQAKMYNKQTLKKVFFVIDPEYTAVAATAGSIVRYNPEWFVKNPGDIDVVTHEVMHIVQSYPGGAGPGWLTEGIADYVRYKYGVDNEGAKWALPEYNSKQRYTDAYRVTARFLVWVENNYDKKLVQKMNATLHTKTYNKNLWQKYTGKTLDELWADYGKDPALELMYH